MSDNLQQLAEQLAGEHFECEDRWYSCPKSPGGCTDSDMGTECNCGRDQRAIAILSALQSAARQGQREALEQIEAQQQELKEIQLLLAGNTLTPTKVLSKAVASVLKDERDALAQEPNWKRVRNLIMKWREEAGEYNDDPYDPAAAYNSGMIRCADELESELEVRASALEGEKL